MRSSADFRRGGFSLRGGFTLIEVVIALAILVIVLVIAYQIFANSLRTEAYVAEVTLPEKVGGGILALMRRDIAGAFFKGSMEPLGNRVFVGVEESGPHGEQDRVFCLTSVTPTPREDLYEWESIRTVCVAGYFLEPNQATDKYPAFTLYRREVTDLGGGDILAAQGMNYAVYDKVKSLSIEYFDGYEWRPEWDSELEVRALEEELALQARDPRIGQTNVPTVSEISPALEGDAALQALAEPTAPIPSAVRIQLELYSGSGRSITAKDGLPVVRTFTTIIPVLASQRIRIPMDEIQSQFGEGGASGMAGDPGGGPGAAGSPGETGQRGFPPGGRGPGARGGGRNAGGGLPAGLPVFPRGGGSPAGGRGPGAAAPGGRPGRR